MATPRKGLRPVTRRALFVALGLVLWTTLSYSILVGLILWGIEPIQTVFSPEPELRQHGKLLLNPAGVILWVQVLAVYSVGSALLVARFLRLTWRQKVGLATAVFVASVVYVAVFHPTFLLVVLSAAQWASYSALAQRYVPGLEEVYQHWGLSRLKYWVLAGQVVLTTLVCFSALLLSGSWGGGRSSRAQSGRRPQDRSDEGGA